MRMLSKRSNSTRGYFCAAECVRIRLVLPDGGAVWGQSVVRQSAHRESSAQMRGAFFVCALPAWRSIIPNQKVYDLLTTGS